MSPGLPTRLGEFLTVAGGAGRPGFRNAISLDQFAAEQIGGRTRFPSLALSGEAPGSPGRGPWAGAVGHLARKGVRQALPRRQAR